MHLFNLSTRKFFSQTVANIRFIIPLHPIFFPKGIKILNETSWRFSKKLHVFHFIFHKYRFAPSGSCRTKIHNFEKMYSLHKIRNKCPILFLHISTIKFQHFPKIFFIKNGPLLQYLLHKGSTNIHKEIQNITSAEVVHSSGRQKRPKLNIFSGTKRAF